MEIFGNNIKQFDRSGFTLIELLVVIGIIATLTVIGVPAYANMQKNLVVNNSAEELANSLRVVQNKSITSLDGEAWGVHFDTTTFTIFSGDWASPTSTTVHTLDSAVQFISTSNSEIVFDRLTGAGSNNTIVIGQASGKQRTIEISTTGSISLP